MLEVYWWGMVNISLLPSFRSFIVLVSLVSFSWSDTYDSSLEDLAVGITEGTGTRTDGTVVEYNIPIEDYPDSVVFELQGGDGGRGKATTDAGEDQAGEGGGGAKIEIEFAISTSDDNALRPGGKFRFIVGNKGGSRTGSEVAGGAGGGGTGILYLEPITGAEWELLCIAGGGGGGAASTVVTNTYAKDGQNGNTGTSGDDARASGGTDGGGGGSIIGGAGGGGGWLTGGEIDDEQGGENGQYSGGNGGYPPDSGADGGFGCGGGGAGYRLNSSLTNKSVGGGGGGGYSGGGAGGVSGDISYYNGGGGGSYAVSWATSSTISTRDGSDSNGYIEVVTFTANTDNGRVPFPSITLYEDSDYQLEPGDDYTDPGALATDVYGQLLTVDVDVPTDLANGVIGDYIVTYSATDQFGGSSSAIRRVSVPYTPPTFELLGDLEVLQAAGEQTVSNFAYNFSDVDGQTLDSYQISTNNDSIFSVEPSIDIDGTLTFTGDPSATGTARVSVRAIDNPDDAEYGISDAVTFNITITEASKPTFNISGDVTVLQGDGAQTVSGFANNFADADGQSLDYYTVTNDNNDLFSTQPSVNTDGTLSFTAEDTSWGSTTVSVYATDNADDPANGTSDPVTFTLTVTEATPPTFELAGDVTVDEDAGAQSVSHFASHFDDNDGDVQGLVEYQVTNNNSTLFLVEPSIDTNGTLTFTSADNTSGSATVSVVAVDDANIGSNGISDTHTFILTVNPVDDLPTNLEIGWDLIYEEYVGTVSTVSAENPLGGNVEGVDLFYEIVGGADADFFYLEESNNSSFSINLVNNTAFDYDNPEDVDGNNDYEVTISVSNSEGSISETFTFYVIERNEAPTSLTLDNTEVEDGETFVGTLIGTDPNEADTLTYSISGSADASLFTVDEASGEVSFLTAPDYANPTDNNADNQYRVRFAVSDGSESYEQLIIIEVVPFDNPPVDLTIDGESVTSIEVAEDVAMDTQLAVLMARDPDMAGPVFFSLTEDADGRFSISNNNRLMRSSTGTLDYEQVQSYELELLATDSTGATTTWTLTINITDVAEAGVEEFRASYGLSSDGSEDAVDSSGNGIANLLYYAFGLGDPSLVEVDESRLPEIAVEAVVSLSYTQPIDTDAGVSVTAKHSTDGLATWTAINPLAADDGSGDPYIFNTEDLGDGYEQITITVSTVAAYGFYCIEVIVE